MKNIYYVIDNEVDSDEGTTLTGNKAISVYEIVNNNPIIFFELDLEH